ncbi:MAG: O-antigen ligase family protein [Patescibacteria group bacterium]|nr:O-antigen ligase family protein [Patescibacteria group bacterium]
MSYLLAITLFLTPAYVARFTFLRLPADALIMWVAIFWLVFSFWLLANHLLQEFWRSIQSLDKKIFIPVLLFFAAGIISLFAHGFDRAKLGQFVVLFLQPVSIFFIGRYLVRKFPETASLLLTTCYLLLALAGAYAIIQYFTLLGLPPAWWGNSDEPKRALSFFVHPNFYALWSAPLLAFLLPDVFENLKSKIINLKSLAWLLGAVGLFLSLSRAGWLGLAAAMAVYLIVAADAKIRKVILVATVCVLAVVLIYPNLRWRVLLPLYGEKSAVSRFSLWHTGLKGISQSPLTGLGLAGFARAWPVLNTDPGLASASHNFPHNIFLDFWVETGVLGLISIMWLMAIFIFRGLKSAVIRTSNKLSAVSDYLLPAALFLIAVIFAGLVDNPYFKNDLAMVFWIILTLG